MIFGTFAAHPRHHINVCRYVPSDEELQEIIDRQEDLNDGGNVNEYSHKAIKIKKFSPRENILSKCTFVNSPLVWYINVKCNSDLVLMFLGDSSVVNWIETEGYNCVVISTD